MEKELYGLVYEYSKHKKIIDESFITYLILLFDIYYGTKDFVKNVNYVSGFEVGQRVNVAKYQVSDREVIINYEAIRYVLAKNKRYETLFSDSEKYFYKNLTILQYVLHELQHAVQNKQSKDKKDTSDEKRIVSGSLISALSISPENLAIVMRFNEKAVEDIINQLLAYRAVYKKYYDKVPLERLAQIDSYERIVKIITHFKDECPSLYDFYVASLYEVMQEGYTTSNEEYSCPTELFLSKIGYENDWQSLSFYDEDPTKLKDKMFKTYCPMERTRLGLILSDDELKTIGEQVKSSSKYQVTRKKS
ncbi:MAG: hypothetical protein K5666_04300 [Bacilli bacterium]|nr:hypothetical protein [Bacilli bacterium]